MPCRYYLPLRHEIIVKTVYKEILLIENTDKQKLINNKTEFITTVNNKEPRWNVPVKTSLNVPRNRLGIIVWDKTQKLCDVIEFRCSGDINIAYKVLEKESIYGQSIKNMKMIYENHNFMFIPIIIVALGHVPKYIFTNIQNFGYTKNEPKKLVDSNQPGLFRH